MKIKISFLVIFFLTKLCVPNKSLVPYEISDKMLYDNWNAGNADYIHYYIKSLNDSTLSDCDFEANHGELVNRILFPFCQISCGDSAWRNLSNGEKLTYRRVILLSLEEYENSCLFMKKKNWYLCENNLMEYCKPELITDSLVLDSFRNELKQICYECSNL